MPPARCPRRSPSASKAATPGKPQPTIPDTTWLRSDVDCERFGQGRCSDGRRHHIRRRASRPLPGPLAAGLPARLTKMRGACSVPALGARWIELRRQVDADGRSTRARSARRTGVDSVNHKSQRVASAFDFMCAATMALIPTARGVSAATRPSSAIPPSRRASTTSSCTTTMTKAAGRWTSLSL